MYHNQLKDLHHLLEVIERLEYPALLFLHSKCVVYLAAFSSVTRRHKGSLISSSCRVWQAGYIASRGGSESSHTPSSCV